MKLAAPIALALSLAASGPRDAETRAWWATTATLSNDAMEGRDTGSLGYDRAARIVAAWFAAAGLTPLGAAGGWLQTVPMAERAVTTADVRVGARPLVFLHDYTVNPVGLPATLDAPLTYRGYCGAADRDRRSGLHRRAAALAVRLCAQRPAGDAARAGRRAAAADAQRRRARRADRRERTGRRAG